MYLEESMEEESEPVRQHLLSNRLGPKHIYIGRRSLVKTLTPALS